MLSFRGTTQPPRSYPFPSVAVDASRDTLVCEFCACHVFTKVWAARFVDAWEAKHDVFTISYERSGQAIRRAGTEGCNWCKALADGIHGTVYLESVYEMYNQSDDVESEVEDVQEDPDVGSVGEQGTANDATETASIGSDVLHSLDVSGKEDLLLHPCDFQIDMTFQKEAHPSFSTLKVRIASVGVQDASCFRILRNDPVGLTYHVHCIGNWAEPMLSQLPIECNLASEANFGAARAWVEKASLSRKPLQSNSNFAPTRLIAVNAEHGPHLALASAILPGGAETVAQSGYVALSYVWGADQKYTLKSCNLHKVTTRIREDALPRSISDAIYVTRRLGFNYLWIDALCIIQDSKQDMATELSKMRLVYQHAALTIVAANASSAAEGFLTQGQPPSYFVDPFEVPFYSKSGSQERMSLGYLANYKRWKDPINSRCWTLQELLLSPRLLVYSYNGLQMIKRSGTSGDIIHDNDVGSWSSNLTWNSPLFTLEGNPRTSREMWLTVRDEYTKRKLTNGKDKLTAIAAIAEEMGSTFGEYVAGLWRDDLVLDLQWRRPDMDSGDYEQTRRSLRPSPYRAPSWSWASIDGEVACFEEEDVQGSFHFWVKHCFVDLVDSTLPYAAVRGARLEVEGLIQELLWRPSTEPMDDRCDGFLAVLVDDDDENPERNVGEATLDALEPCLLSGSTVQCLAISLVERIPERVEVEGIMLLSVDSDCYRRIGFFKVYSQLVYEGCRVSAALII